ncbi:adenosine receptor A2b [Lingula anatina]|uniref:Adenosine receptor A2b n=1 Tax=Lingula anatina TaxID=7574 RepID=A0A1S3ICV5_LINAN|nr:adenosine receptor A2b [Lingula anatina]|eukprot:XP_013395998.1 adenosine receptor A2b [Lingula anatina]
MMDAEQENITSLSEDTFDGFLDNANFSLSQNQSDTGASWLIFASVGLAITVTGFLENVVSILALSHMRRPLEPFHYLLVNLAIADLIVVGFASIGNALFLYAQTVDRSSDTFCWAHFFMEISYISLPSTLLATSALVFNQYLAVSKILNYRSMVTKRKVVFCITLFWICTIAIGAALQAVTAYRNRSTLPENADGHFWDTLCAIYDTQDYYTFSAYTYFILFIVITTLVAIVYAKTYFDIKHQLSGVRNLRRSIRRTRSSAEFEATQQTKVNATIALLFGTIVIFWLPGIADALITVYLLSIAQDCQPCKIIHQITNLMFIANALLDPVIYGVRINQVRGGYHRLLKRCTKVLCRQSRAANVNGLGRQGALTSLGYERTSLYERANNGMVFSTNSTSL